MAMTFLTLAQVAPEDIEVTAGGIIAGLLVMSALAGSITMIAIWVTRYRQTGQVLPVADRNPLFVPKLLMVCGIGLTVLMASVAMQGAPADTTEVAGENAEVEGLAEEQMQQMIMGTLTMNAMMFLTFGAVIWLSQFGYRRGDMTGTPVNAESLNAFSTIPSGIDEEAIPVDVMASSENPYAAPLQEADNSTVPVEAGSGTPPWHFSTELRFAVEAVLVAYLPTAALRIGIVTLLPDSSSHPFLKMMQDGVAWDLMALIGLMAVIVAPVVEELLYRVTILGGLMHQRSTLIGWVVSSVLFSFAHGFPDSIALLPLAFVIGYTYIQRRSYRTVVLIHFLFNGFNMLIAGVSLV